MGLEGFCCLTKPQEHLLSKKYCFGSLALLSLHSAGGPVVFKAKAAQQPDSSVSASTSLSVKAGAVTFSPKLSTTGSKSLSFSYSASSSLMLRALASLSSSDQASAQVTAVVKQKLAKAEITASHPPAVKVAVVTGKKCCGVGVEAEYEVAAGRVVTYNFLQYYKGKDFRVVLKHLSTDALHYTLGDFHLSYYSRTSPKTQLAAKALLNWASKDICIEFGATYEHSGDVTLRAKVDSQGRLAAGVTKAIGKDVMVSMGTEVDAKKAAQMGVSDYHFGARVDIEI